MIGFPFWSVLKCILYDNRYSSTSVKFIQDLNSNFINCILPSKAIYPDGTNDKVDTIEFNYEEPKNKTNTPIVFLATANDFGGTPTTIDDVLAYFNSLGDYGTTHWLRKYTELIAINFGVIKKNDAGVWKDILLNDRKVVRREYNPSYTPVDGSTDADGNTTFPATNIYVHMNHEKDLKIFTVMGDQTDPSGEEYLDGAYGGYPPNV